MTTLAVLVASFAPLHADPKRPVPDYDGRGNPDADADTWPLWIPRIALSPLYLTDEFVLRRPLGALVTHAERARWADSVVRLFTFGEGGKSLIVPTALVDFGLLPSVGFYYSGDDVFAAGNVLRLHAAGWGTRWINATAADRYMFDPADSVQARFEFRRAQDNLFFGIGPDVTRDARSRYGLQRIEGSVSYRRVFNSESRFVAESGVHRLSFTDGDCCNDLSLDTQIARGELMAPPGYRTTYAAAFERLDLTLDSRRPRPEPGSGVYLQAQLRPSFDLHDPRAWLEYGGVLGAAVDLTGHRRTIRMQLALDLVDPLEGDGDQIPFTEYAVLGGDLMPGFVPGWMTGRSTASAQLGYSWPIWVGLDAQMRFTLGNAFGAHLDGLSTNKLRMSGDIGLTTSTIRDQGFELLFGLGTETFAQGADITSVRFTVGSRRGF